MSIIPYLEICIGTAPPNGLISHNRRRVAVWIRGEVVWSRFSWNLISFFNSTPYTRFRCADSRNVPAILTSGVSVATPHVQRGAAGGVGRGGWVRAAGVLPRVSVARYGPRKIQFGCCVHVEGRQSGLRRVLVRGVPRLRRAQSDLGA